MCGFAGVVGAYARDNLSPMDQQLAHRGPDSRGLFSEEGIGICHRRLEIQGLGVAGQQPMESPAGHYVLAFNGKFTII